MSTKTYTYQIIEPQILQGTVYLGPLGSKGMGNATKNNYRKLFLEKFPDLPKGHQVHHTLP
ncbi:MAG: hypothetical protein VB130_04000 [Clostridium sp.]|nr:hypothetical protein [Clostridium sp.]